MTSRTFQQHALAFGTTPCQVVCQINGNTIYSGTVTTLDEPKPTLPDAVYKVNNVAWSWQGDADFVGTQSITIAVTGSNLLLADTFANDPNGNVEEFGSFYSVEIDGVIFSDPFTDEAIDGVPQAGPYNPSLSGQWWWFVPAGSTFSATLHVDAPPVAPPEPSPE